jgi:hypothetical protein
LFTFLKENAFDEYTLDCPTGLYRLFLSRATQQTLNLKADEDVTQEDNVRSVRKQLLLDDIAHKHATSDFYPFKKLIDEYPDEEICFAYDHEFQHDKNFYICLDTNLKEIINNVRRSIITFVSAEVGAVHLWSCFVLFISSHL